MRSLRAIVLAVVIGVTCAAPCAADTDLACNSANFTQIGGSWYVQYNLGVKMDTDTADHDATLTIKHYRGTELIGTILDDEFRVVKNTNCTSCVTACSGTCQILLDGATKNGTCVANGDKTCGPTTIKCVCSVSSGGTIGIGGGLQTHDRLVVAMAAESGITEESLANNSCESEV